MVWRSPGARREEPGVCGRPDGVCRVIGVCWRTDSQRSDIHKRLGVCIGVCRRPGMCRRPGV